VLEGLIVFLINGTEGAGFSIPPGDMGRKVASTRQYLVNAATYIPRKASEGMWSEEGTVKI